MILINDKYAIDTDKYNWILKEKRFTDPTHRFAKSKEVKEYYVELGFFGTIEQLLKSLVNKDLKESEYKNLSDLVKQLKHTENTLKIEVEKVLHT